MEEVESNLHSNQIAEETDKEANTDETSTKTNSRLTRRQIFVLVSLIYNQFWGACCYSIQAPFFPEEAKSKGATSTEYGMVFSVFELMIIVMSPVFGRMIPTVSPKFLIVAGSFLEGGSCALFGVLDRIHGRTQFIVMAFLVRIVEGLGAAAFITACFTIIASEFPNAIGRAFSLTETFFGFGLIAGPTVGGMLYQAGGFLLPFIVCGGLMFIGSLVFLLLLPSVEDTGARRSISFAKFLKDPGVLTHVFTIVTTFVFIGFNAGTLEPHLRSFSIKPAILGLIFVITGGVYAFTTPLWGWLADRGVDSYSMMGLGYVITIVGTLFIGPLPFFPFEAKLWIVIVSLVVMGFGMAAKLIAGFTGAVKIAPLLGFPDNLITFGMISGLLSLAASLGAFIGPSLGGLLLDTTGYAAGTYVLLGQEIFFLLLLVALVVWRKRNPQDAETTPILRPVTRESSVVINEAVR